MIDGNMTDSQWRAFAEALLVRQGAILDNLAHNDLRAVESIGESQHEQLEAISTLLAQVPRHIRDSITPEQRPEL